MEGAPETIEIKDSEPELEDDMKLEIEKEKNEAEAPKICDVEDTGIKEKSSDEAPGPSRTQKELEIVDITDDTSNSSNAVDFQVSKPVVTEPDDMPSVDSISTTTSKSSTDIIEIIDPTGDNFEVEFVENVDEQKETSETDNHLEKIPEEEIEDVEKTGTTNENNLPEHVPENIGDLKDEAKNDKPPEVEKNKEPENEEPEPAKTSSTNIENEIAALEKSGEKETLEVVDEQSAINGVDDTQSTTGTSADATSSKPTQPATDVQDKPSKDEKALKIPPHLIGHNLEKPVESIKNGRVTVKPRLGVKVPYRNLTSQIVSKQEITDVIMERSRQRQMAADPPTGNVLFAKKLTNRLANKLSPNNKTSKPTETTVASAASVPPLLPPSSERIANNSDLIALLEGDDDTDWNIIGSKKNQVKNADWERETALKQLQDLPKLGKKETDEEPRLSLNPVTKTYTRKRKPSEDIKSILEAAKKPALTPHSTKTTSVNTPAKTAGQTPGKSLGSSHKSLSKSTPTPQKVVQTPLKSGSTQKIISKSLVTPKPKGTEQKDLKMRKEGEGPKNTPTNQKAKPGEQKTTPNTLQKQVVLSKAATPTAEQKSVLGHKQVKASDDQKTQSPKTPKPKSLSIQKSIQNIRNLSQTSPPVLPPHAKLSTDRKAIIILSASPEFENKKSLSHVSDKSDDSDVKTPVAKKPLSPNTYISKSSRVVKRKKIWDPDEATPIKLLKPPRSLEATPSEKKGSPATSAEKKTIAAAKKNIKRAIAKKKKYKRLTEIDRLLMDEGAVNLLYSVRNTEAGKRKNKSVISIDKAERDLLNKTNEIKNDLLQNNVTNDTPIGLRKKTGTLKSSFKDPAAIILHRKKSKDSTEGSVHVQTPPASPAYVFHENVSRLIRRHSSSSFTSKESEDEESADEKPIKKRVEKQRKNSIVVENNATNEIVIDNSKYSEFETLNVRKFDKLVQIILVPESANAHITLTLEVLEELTEILGLLQLDSGCRVVVVTSAGNSFCLGIDYKELVASSMKERKAIAKEYATAVRAFLMTLSKFSKLIVAGVHGNTVGLGVTMLPLFDMVLASDTATFSTQYTRLGCAAEGGALLKLPHVMHNALASELFFASRKLTAAEALRLGLVTRTLWPDKFQEELISSLKIISGQSLQSMEAIKKQLRHQLLITVEPSLKSESNVLIQHWISSECQSNFENYSFESK